MSPQTQTSGYAGVSLSQVEGPGLSPTMGGGGVVPGLPPTHAAGASELNCSLASSTTHLGELEESLSSPALAPPSGSAPCLTHQSQVMSDTINH